VNTDWQDEGIGKDSEHGASNERNQPARQIAGILATWQGRISAFAKLAEKLQGQMEKTYHLQTKK